MTRNIAQAKQQFSDVVRLSAQTRHEPTLTEQFAELRLALQEAQVQELEIPERSTAQRPNAFVQTLEAEGLIGPRRAAKPAARPTC